MYRLTNDVDALNLENVKERITFSDSTKNKQLYHEYLSKMPEFEEQYESEEDEDEHHGKHDAEGGDTSDDDDDASASTRKSLVNLIVTGKRSRKPNPLYFE